MVWETHRDVVEEQLKTLLGVDKLDNKDSQYFQQHNAAAKLAYKYNDSMYNCADSECRLGLKHFPAVLRNIKGKLYKHFPRNAG